MACSEGLPASVKKCGNEFLSSLLSSLSGHVLKTRPGGGQLVIVRRWFCRIGMAMIIICIYKKARSKKWFYDARGNDWNTDLNKHNYNVCNCVLQWLKQRSQFDAKSSPRSNVVSPSAKWWFSNDLSIVDINRQYQNHWWDDQSYVENEQTSTIWQWLHKCQRTPMIIITAISANWW